MPEDLPPAPDKYYEPGDITAALDDISARAAAENWRAPQLLWITVEPYGTAAATGNCRYGPGSFRPPPG